MTDWRKLMQDKGKGFFSLETRAVLKQPQEGAK